MKNIGCLIFIILFTLVSKVSEAQTWLWSVKAGGIQMDSVLKITTDKEGFIYSLDKVKGVVNFGNLQYTCNTTFGDLIVVKYSSIGNPIKIIPIAYSNNALYGTDIGIDSTFHLYVSAWFVNTAIINGISYTSGGIYTPKGFISKIDSFGNFLWTNFVTNAQVTGIKIMEGGKSYITGNYSNVVYFTPNDSFTSVLYTQQSGITIKSNDIYIASYNSSGTFLQATSKGGTAFDYPTAIDVDRGGNVYIGGVARNYGSSTFPICNIDTFSFNVQSGQDCFLFKLDSITMTAKWFKRLTTYNDINDIALNNRNEIFLGGRREGFLENNMQLGKFNTANGNSIWQHTIGNGNGVGDLCYGVDCDTLGNSYYVGKEYGTCNFGSITISGNIFFVKYNSLGTPTVGYYVSSNDGKVSSIKCDASGNNIYIGGNFSGTGNFGGTTLSSTGFSNIGDIFISKLGTVVTPIANFTSNKLIFCKGELVKFYDKSINSATHWNWKFNGVIKDSSTIQFPTFSADSSGIDTVTLIVSNGAGSDTITKSITFIVHDVNIPMVITSDSTLCAGDTLTLFTTSLNKRIWSTGDTSSSIKVFNSGYYSVSITDTNGCVSISSSQKVIKFSLPNKPLISSTTPAQFCFGDSVQLVATSSMHYKWNSGDTLASIIIKSSGDYFVEISDSNTCSAKSDTIHINVHNLPVKPVITALPSWSVCTGDSIKLTSSIAFKYKWNTNDTTVAISTNTGQSYWIVISDSNGCINSSDTVKTVINSLPTIPILSAINTIKICAGDSLKIYSSSANGYLWNNNSTDSFIVVKSAGNYFVIISDTNGCKAKSDSTQILIHQPKNGLSIKVSSDTLFSPYNSPNIWFKNGDTTTLKIGDLFICNQSATYFVLGLDSNGCMAKSDTVYSKCYPFGISNISNYPIISLYPNPVSNTLTIIGFVQDIKTIEVGDVLGQLVLSINPSSQLSKRTFILNTENLPQGIYFIKATNQNGDMMNSKFIKQ